MEPRPLWAVLPPPQSRPSSPPPPSGEHPGQGTAWRVWGGQDWTAGGKITTEEQTQRLGKLEGACGVLWDRRLTPDPGGGGAAAWM